VNATQFNSYIDKKLDEPIIYSVKICKQVRWQIQTCASYGNISRTLKNAYHDVKYRLQAVVELCDRGLTAPGGYHFEECVMRNALPRDGDYDTLEVTRPETKCFKQFQCMLTPAEMKSKGWSKELGLMAVIKDTSLSPRQIGASALMSQYLESYYGQDENRLKALRSLAAGSTFIVGLITLAIVCPPSMTFSAPLTGFLHWGILLFKSSWVASFMIPDERVDRSVGLADVAVGIV
jgi:hypothetical protein